MSNANGFVAEPFGPLYPKLGAGVAKFRKLANPTAEQRQAHGAAVEAAILASQSAWWRTERAVVPPNCASGTWHNNADGSVGEAIRAKQNAALLAWPDKQRRERTDAELREAYQRAMAEKWSAERLAPPEVVARVMAA